MIREYKKENNTFLTSHHLFKGPDLGYKRYTLDYIGIPIAHCRSHPHEGNWNGNSPRKPASNLRMARGETCYTLNMTESHHLVRLDCKVSWWIGHIKSEIQPLEVSKQSSPKNQEATTWTRYGHDMGNWTRSRAKCSSLYRSVFLARYQHLAVSTKLCSVYGSAFQTTVIHL